jgi:hypothetical protein
LNAPFTELPGAGAKAEKIGETKVRVGVCYFPPASCAGYFFNRLKTFVKQPEICTALSQ